MPELPEIAGFVTLAPLGRGGFASVYRAQRSSDGAELAIKVGSTAPLRLEREARALERIGPPTVPALVSRGRTLAGQPYLAMELLRGESLANWLASLPGTGRPPLDEAFANFDGLCAAVERAHRAGIAHRDLKPENAFLTGDGRVVLLDFGLARFDGEADSDENGADRAALTRSGERLGTAVYMAPEQILESRNAGRAADVYSLGVLLYELLTARPPFVGEPSEVLHAHVALRPPSPSSFAPVSKAAEEIVLRCLAKDPAARFANAGDLRSAARVAAAENPRAQASHARTTAPHASRSSVRTVVLLGVRSVAPANRLMDVIRTEGGELARIQSGRYVFSFDDKPSLEIAARAAFRAARSLLERNLARTARVHAAELQEHARPGGAALMGLPLEQPDTWWPQDVQESVSATSEVATRFQVSGWPEVAPNSPPAPAHDIPGGVSALHGRGALLASLCADARTTWESRVPALATLVGEVGLGKTRVLQQLCEELASHARVLRISAGPPGEDHPQTILRALLAGALCLGDGVSTAEARHRLWERLPEATARSVWPGVVFALGVQLDEEGQEADVLLAPGARRHESAKAVAECIRAAARDCPLAIALDGAQWAEPAALDALEIATLLGEPSALWVCAAARPAFFELRPFWGDRAGRRAQFQLAPLDADASRALLLDLLRPADFVPEPVLRQLAEAGAGLPLSLVEIVNRLRLDGAIRPHAGGTGWHLAADELLSRSPTPLYERLAQRAVRALTPGLRSLVDLCAAIGDEVTIEEVSLAQEAVTRGAEAGSGPASIDPAFGLERLSSSGILNRLGVGRYAFRHALLREALERLTPAADRTRLHAVLLDLLSTSPRGAPLERMARHAAAVGDWQRAGRCRLELGEQARQSHRYPEAEQHYTAALGCAAHLSELDRLGALSGRGRVRYRAQRFQDALADLRAARELADRIADPPVRVDLLLEEATVLDWLEDFPASFHLVEKALALVKETDDARLEVRCALARGRMHRRREEWEAAIDVLTPMIELAQRVGDAESQAIGLLLLAGLAADQDRLEDSEARFEQLLALCSRTGDVLHLGAAYCLRPFLWLKRGSIERAFSDLRQAIGQARELGNAQIERFASFNLAQCLYWTGDSVEALQLARRAQELGLRFFQASPTPADALLLARILASSGERRAAREQFEWVKANFHPDSLPGDERLLYRLAELLTADPDAGGSEELRMRWRMLLEQAKGDCVHDYNYLEILWAGATAALRGGHEEEATHWAEELNRSAQRSGFWRKRLEQVPSTRVAE